MADPLTAVTLIGSSLVAGIIMYVIVDQVMRTNGIAGGMWSLGLLMLSVTPVVFAVLFVFRG